jgi:hypothetical protein
VLRCLRKILFRKLGDARVEDLANALGWSKQLGREGSPSLLRGGARAGQEVRPWRASRGGMPERPRPARERVKIRSRGNEYFVAAFASAWSTHV